MVPFVLNCIRQRAMSPQMLDMLKTRVQQLIEEEYGIKKEDKKRKTIETKLQQARAELRQAGKNLALMSTPSQVEAVKVVYDDLQAEVIRLEALRVSPPPKQRKSVEEEITLAIKRLENLNVLASSPDHRAAVDELISSLDVRVFCRFIETNQNNQVRNRLIGGMVTFGSRPAPVKTYQGPVGRSIIKNKLANGERDSLFAGDTVDKNKQQPHGSESSLLRNQNWRTR